MTRTLAINLAATKGIHAAAKLSPAVVSWCGTSPEAQSAKSAKSAKFRYKHGFQPLENRLVKNLEKQGSNA